MDQTDTGLRAVTKALTDVIGPALDPKDPLAREQLKLAVDYVEFVRARFSLIHGRERFDLRHYVRMAEAFGRAGAPAQDAAVRALAATLGETAPLLDDPDATTQAIRTAAMELAAAIAATVQAAPSFDREVRRRIERAVLEATDERIAMERAWYLPMGFDPAPRETGNLGDLLAR